MGLEQFFMLFKFAVAPTQIAFGGAASTSVKVYGAHKGGSTSATDGMVSFDVVFSFIC